MGTGIGTNYYERVMPDEQRNPHDTNRLWEKVGEFDGRITNLEAGQYQQQQANVNLRAELNGNFQRHEDRVEKWLHEVKDEILAPLGIRVARMEKFLYMAAGASAVIVLLLKLIPLLLVGK